ncbi:MAG: dipicolinate synthase subunit B [Clostridiales bacterium]|jgi:dipicolinate synthase subunit B|nr:dipicolinate synthase subunit B [Clostridiales bacterium]
MFDGLRVGFAITGSFCNFDKILTLMQELSMNGADILPIFSEHVSEMDTRFMSKTDFFERVKFIADKDPICTIQGAEPIGPKKMTDIILVAPCTGNTLAKLAYSITDTPVTMACKSHLRSQKPIVLAISTNDGLSGSAKNIGLLLNTKYYFFVPFGQDDPINKPNSLVADYSKTETTIIAALEGKQMQPVLLGKN